MVCISQNLDIPPFLQIITAIELKTVTEESRLAEAARDVQTKVKLHSPKTN